MVFGCYWTNELVLRSIAEFPPENVEERESRWRLVTRDVYALTRIAVPVGPVAAAVNHAINGQDAEVCVTECAIGREPRRAALDVESVVSCLPGGVVLDDAVTVLGSHQERVVAASLNDVPADDVASAPGGELTHAEEDAGAASAYYEIAGDNVVTSVLDGDATEDVTLRVVASDDVPIASNEEAHAVSPAAIPADLVAVGLHQDPRLLVLGEDVVLDDVAGGVLDVHAKPVA